MKLDASSFTALLYTLGLTQGSSKPIPQTLDSSSSIAPPSPPLHLNENNYLPVINSRDQSEKCFVDPYHPPPVDEQVFAPYNVDIARFYRYRQQQSVNLGSWFVHENWMTPSLFKCAAGDKLSELDIASGWGSLDSARHLLERHWDTWITEADFKYLASIGINTVRLPIGYWNLGPHFCVDTPFSSVADVYRNSWPRIVHAINMAAEVGIGVLVDLHGAPGSQNGQPHSGISDHETHLFDSQKTKNKTFDVLVFLMQQLSTVTNVVGIQILNEPYRDQELNNFYSRAIETMRQTPSSAAASFPLYVHNGFDLEACTAYVANRTDFVVQDHHSYFVFTPEDENKPASTHAGDVKGPIADRLSQASGKQRRNIIIGEWSCALTPQSISNETDKYQVRRNFCEGQMNVYANTTAGWSFWSYLKEECENDPGWCFKAAVNNSLPATFFSYNRSSAPELWQMQAVSGMVVPPVSDILPGTQRDIEAAAGTPATLRRTFEAYSWYRRFEVIHYHQRQKRGVVDESQLSPAQKSTVKGYRDGFLAAQSFALFQYSKLGFSGQFISDRLEELGPSIIVSGTEQDYGDGFGRGLEQGQNIVTAVLNPGR